MGLSTREIAARLGISPSAVSFALNNKPGVSEETRRQVIELATEYGYGSRKRNGDDDRYGIIQFVIYKSHGSIVGDTPFFARLSEGISLQTQKRGYKLQITYFYENQNIEKQMFSLAQQKSDGIIMLATEANLEDVKRFRELSVPLVVLDSYFEDESIDSVVINNVQGAYRATRHLIENGHTKIGYLSSNVAINNFRERADGFFRAVRESEETKPSYKNVFKVTPTYDGAYADIIEHFKDKKIDMPTAFFADNDIIASSFIRALKDMKFSLPNDVSVIGFDDMPVCELMRPAITTMIVPKERLGVLAVNRLVSLIRGEADETIKIEVFTELVERDSVKDLNQVK